jgi:hypothetical protein
MPRATVGGQHVFPEVIFAGQREPHQLAPDAGQCQPRVGVRSALTDEDEGGGCGGPIQFKNILDAAFQDGSQAQG